MKFDQLTEYNMRNIFRKMWWRNYFHPDPFLENQD